jgi:hypothetical protein
MSVPDYQDCIVPDCLVFKLEEVDSHGDTDMKVFIIYDSSNETYLVRGSRRSETSRHCSYSYESRRARDLVDFLQYLICPSHRVNETLYNYDNLPESSSDITYDFLSEYEDKKYEISGYDNEKLGKKRLLRNLRMLKHVCNYY